MKKNNFSFSYTDYKTFGHKIKKISNPPKINYFNFIKSTSIATSTMMIKRSKIGNIKFTNTKICEDYFFKCRLLKKVKFAYCLKKYLTRYRIRKNSLQSNNLRNIYWIWKINKNFNKLNFANNFISLLFISINSLRKYGGKNIFQFQYLTLDRYKPQAGAGGAQLPLFLDLKAFLKSVMLHLPVDKYFKHPTMDLT